MKIRDKLTFILMLRYLLESGIPVAYSLSILEKTFSDYSTSIAYARKMIKNGQLLSYSLHKSNLLDELEVSILKIGETSENLIYSLKKLEELVIKKQNLIQNITRSLIYPILFLFVLSFIMVIFKNFIVPAFNNLYLDLGIEIPFFFKLLSSLTSLFDVRILLFLFLLIVILFLFVRYFFRSDVKSMYKYIFMVPILGKIFYEAYTGLVLNLWAVALESGLPYSLTFRILKDETIEPFSLFFSRMNELAKRGELYEIVNYSNAFKTSYVKQMNASLESGELPFTLKKLAEMAEIETNTALDTLNRILEPLMATLAGFITATLALSIFSPIIHIIKNI